MRLKRIGKSRNMTERRHCCPEAIERNRGTSSCAPAPEGGIHWMPKTDTSLEIALQIYHSQKQRSNSRRVATSSSSGQPLPFWALVPDGSRCSCRNLDSNKVSRADFVTIKCSPPQLGMVMGTGISTSVELSRNLNTNHSGWCTLVQNNA